MEVFALTIVLICRKYAFFVLEALFTVWYKHALHALPLERHHRRFDHLRPLRCKLLISLLINRKRSIKNKFLEINNKA